MALTDLLQSRIGTVVRKVRIEIRIVPHGQFAILTEYTGGDSTRLEV